MKNVLESFQMPGEVAVITGGAGLLGGKHAETIAEMGGIPILLDVNEDKLRCSVENIKDHFDCKAEGFIVDITSSEEVALVKQTIIEKYGRVDILINNAANNPKVGRSGMEEKELTRFENFSCEAWNQDLAVGLTGSFNCSQAFGGEMAKCGKGVILNIASDLALIAPDQRLYEIPGVAEDQQPVKPVTYSVVKTGIVGLTRYLATYWAHKGVRVNAIAPGGVYVDQSEDFLRRISKVIPLGRMADQDEYKAAVAFMVSSASSYMTGAVLSVDGGRSAW
jgi:NAD(P)-dependent dehydrogenase (short-subunit alcohol dehydrogenase family)